MHSKVTSHTLIHLSSFMIVVIIVIIRTQDSSQLLHKEKKEHATLLIIVNKYGSISICVFVLIFFFTKRSLCFLLFTYLLYFLYKCTQFLLNCLWCDDGWLSGDVQKHRCLFLKEKLSCFFANALYFFQKEMPVAKKRERNNNERLRKLGSNK